MPYRDSDHLGEFDIIRRFFVRNDGAPNVLMGIGDDCALLSAPPPGFDLAITTDMLVENRHFFSEVDPEKLGHKALAVNLSDLAAMGATPVAYTLSLALPGVDLDWLERFSKGMHHLANIYHCHLIGGDTTSGPLTISITAFGHVPHDQVLRRNQAQVGDDIWVSNTLGEARLALGMRRGEWQLNLPWEQSTLRMDAPTPRVELGIALRGIAHAAIDVSDGLLGDLSHILRASKCAAQIWIDNVPVNEVFTDVSLELRRLCALRGGDDYELCFTAPQSQRDAILEIEKSLQLPLTRIGTVVAHDLDSFMPAPLLQLFDKDLDPLPDELARHYQAAFDHFL